jgi:cytochrome c
MRPAVLLAPVLAVSLGLIGPGRAAAEAVAFGDAEAGAEVFLWCSGCHEIGPDAQDSVGPHLNGLFGRRAGAHEGYDYSESLARMGADGLVWDLETLDAYIEVPQSLVSGTRMSFPGIEDQQERNDLLAFLRRYSDSPANIPEAPPTALHVEVALPEEVLALVGDPEYGEYLASECLTCHQKDGSAQGIPSITKWPERNFVVAMHAYRQQLRPHPVMQMVAARLSDEEIAALAAYFKTLD